jgi:hypothetical protein
MMIVYRLERQTMKVGGNVGLGNSRAVQKAVAASEQITS